MESNPDFLLVEDNLIDQIVAQKLLKKVFDKNPLFIANNGREALDWLLNHLTSDSLIVLLDIQMPIMNGFDFLTEFDKITEEIKKKIKIYILSSTLDCDEIKKLAEDKNVTKFLHKPFPAALLKNEFLQS
ncbi:response regulator [Flavobacterium foetidum]|uniref:response regulator n=1 Tax=Flavobacterium foetidum TaxID=2026681 RepID=UPI0010758C04|nr:response regulator [Flavobacterium foetidum]KAF2515139.1 response regulator [Flavobacterium foetidum]